MARPRVGPSPRKPRRAAPTRTFVLGACRTPKADKGIGPGLGPVLFIYRGGGLPTFIIHPIAFRVEGKARLLRPRNDNVRRRAWNATRKRGPSEKSEGRGRDGWRREEISGRPSPLPSDFSDRRQRLFQERRRRGEGPRAAPARSGSEQDNATTQA